MPETAPRHGCCPQMRCAPRSSGTDRTWYDVGDTLALSLDESTVRELIAEVQH